LIITTTTNELVEQLLLSGWWRSVDDPSTFYWPGLLPR
jgi:hypothetical protein